MELSWCGRAWRAGAVVSGSVGPDLRPDRVSARWCCRWDSNPRPLRLSAFILAIIGLRLSSSGSRGAFYPLKYGSI